MSVFIFFLACYGMYFGATRYYQGATRVHHGLAGTRWPWMILFGVSFYVAVILMMIG